MPRNEPGRFVIGGFRRHGFITDRQQMPDPTMVTRHTVWEDSLGQRWRAAGRLPFGFAPDQWVRTYEVSAIELATFHRRTRTATALGAIASLILFTSAAIVAALGPIWLTAALVLVTGATGGAVAHKAGRNSRRADAMFAVPVTEGPF